MILNELKLLRKEVGEMRGDLNHLKQLSWTSSSSSRAKIINVENYAFHKEYLTFLKNEFSKHLWLDTGSESFKAEVKKHMQGDLKDNGKHVKYERTSSYGSKVFKVKVFVTDLRKDGRKRFNVPKLSQKWGTLTISTNFGQNTCYIIIIIFCKPCSAYFCQSLVWNNTN